MYMPNPTFAIQEWERLRERGSYRSLPDVESPQSVASDPAAAGAAPAAMGGVRNMPPPKALEVQDQVLAAPDDPPSAGSSPGNNTPIHHRP